MSSNEVGRLAIREGLSLSVPFLVLMLVTTLLVGSALGMLEVSTCWFVVGGIITAAIIVLRQDEVAATLVVVTHIYIDWYLGLEIVGTGMALGLLLIFFVTQNPRRPWIFPRALWLWCLFLLLAIPSVIQGAQGLYDLAYYYPNIICGALLAFWLGSVVAHNTARLRNLFKLLALLGALLALHNLIQATTGQFLFGSTRFDAFLTRVSGFALANSNIHRIGSFFINPDWNGTFLATMLLLPICLFVEASSPLEKLLYQIEMVLMMIALLFTYSTGAWISCFVGIIVFTIFIGQGYYRILVPCLIVSTVGWLLASFPAEANLLLMHAANPVALRLRLGAWQTAIQMIRAFPLSGVGLGLFAYQQKAESYRVPSQYIPLAHPHNAYLEIGAMAGLPVMVIFIALLLLAFWQSLRNWFRADLQTRTLLGGGIAAIVVLCINSLSINGWTLPPLAAVGWLILGAIASPLLIKNNEGKNE